MRNTFLCSTVVVARSVEVEIHLPFTCHCSFRRSKSFSC